MNRIIFNLSLIIISLIIGFLIGHTFIKEDHIDVPVPDKLISEGAMQSLSAKLRTEDPLHTICRDLLAKPELIPYDGVLGGTMGYLDQNNIRILNDKWVVARFEDGHISGKMLLRFEIDNDSKISWKVIDSYLD